MNRIKTAYDLAYLFVYGTLLSEINPPGSATSGREKEAHRKDPEIDEFAQIKKLLKTHTRKMENAFYRGKMYLIQSAGAQAQAYPGVVSSADQNDIIRGEILQTEDSGHLFHELDQYEECGDHFQKPNEYRRTIVEVEISGGKKVMTQIYLYNRSTTGLPRINETSFAEYLRKRTLI